MNSLLLLGLSSFFLAVILTPFCRDLFRSWGVVDIPDKDRKRHMRPIARVGGVAIVLAYAGAFLLLFCSPLRNELLRAQHLPFIVKLAPAGLLIFATGLIDDLISLKPWYKLLGQVAAASWVYWAGVQVTMFFGGPSPGNHWAYPLTVIWLVVCANAFNFIDGVDGLAAGLGFFATVTTLVAALLDNNIYLAMATVPLAGSLLGFLIFNFHPASIFLGDSGSLFIGFLLGCYGIIWSQKSATLLGMTAPLMALSVPILDVCLSVARRLIRNKPIFTADHGHIHHQLLERGWAPSQVTLMLYAATALGAIFSVVQSVYHNQYSRLIIILFCVIASIGIRKLNYIEFSLARRILFGGEFTTMLNARLFMKRFERTLEAAVTVEQCRKAIEDACRELGFSCLKMSLAGHVSELQILDSSPENQYQLLIPLAGSDYIYLTRDFFCSVQANIVSSFIDALRRSLREKLIEGGALAVVPPALQSSAQAAGMAG
jgi:UDP-GlcNAc:undecaprenyl-phosphate/decaprenyl-phosphate GlcNAc-1-phosphate transferase